MTTAFTSITLPKNLADRIKTRIDGTGFTSLSSYVTFVLREILGQNDGEKGIDEDETISRSEKKELMKRLKNLGYI